MAHPAHAHAILEFEGRCCTHRLAMIADMRTSIREITEIHESEMVALIDGDPLARSHAAERLKLAVERKGLTIERYQRHVSEHGC